MRHGKRFNQLSRKKNHRDAMLSNMAVSLILAKRIETTVAKAKALRQYVEPLITKSKNDTTHNRRVVFRALRDKYAVTELFNEVSPKVADRNGGYTRIIKLGPRLGDNAEMAMIELVDFNEHLLSLAAEETETRTRRSRRSRSRRSSAKEETPVAAVEETVEEAVVEEPVVQTEESAATEEETPVEETTPSEETQEETTTEEAPNKEEEK